MRKVASSRPAPPAAEPDFKVEPVEWVPSDALVSSLARLLRSLVRREAERTADTEAVAGDGREGRP